MANSIPLWYMCGSRSCPQQDQTAPCEKTPPVPPQSGHTVQNAAAALTRHFRQTDPETLLLLALLWLLWQEHADRKLLLALAYIIW